MPFVVTKDAARCPVGRPWAVKKQGTDRTYGCHPSREAGLKQAAALYANVSETKAAGEMPPNLGDAEEGSSERCETCSMFFGYGEIQGFGFCSGYSNVQVRPDEVCDSYDPATEAKSESGHPEVPMTTTSASPVLAPKTVEWRRDRAKALSDNQRKRTETRQAHVPLELRDGAEDGKRVLRSYASLFDESYVVRAAGYRFEEVVRPGAFKRTLGTKPDVVFRTEHSGPPLAATWSNDLRLGEDERGLWYEVDLDTTDPDVQSLISKVNRGVYRESSFAFRVPTGGDRWNDDHDLREVIACELDRGDVSVVTFGASRATGEHMLLRSEEEAVHALQDLGFERLMEVFREWRDFTLIPREERVGKVLSSASMGALRQVLDLMANADDSLDEAEAMLSDFLNIPNPDEDHNVQFVGKKSGSPTSSEQLEHTGRSEEERNDPTYEDYDIMCGLKQVKMAIACVQACQLADPDYATDPDDGDVMDALNAANDAIDAAIIAQAQDSAREPDEEMLNQFLALSTRSETEEHVALQFALEPLVALREGEDAYWLASQDDVPEEDRADLSAAGRQAMAKAGTAMPDGSYPIPNVAYLKKAIRAFGRAKASKRAAVKAWIKKRAAALGATNLIPDSWRSASEKPIALVPNDSEDLRDAFRLRRAS